MKLTLSKFFVKCYSHGDTNWKFKYSKDCLLTLRGIITGKLMHNSNMWDKVGKPCLLVVKNGNATSTTISHTNSIFSIIYDYFKDMSINQTSIEWRILNYDSKSEVLSECGNLGLAIANICGHIGGMLTGSFGNTKSFNMTYIMPF
jgi:hypothetical protein